LEPPVLTFLTAAATSRLGLKKKVLLGIAEERGGRRGGGNAFANTGLAAVAAAAVATPYREAALVAFVAALATGGADTVASEIGKAWAAGPTCPRRSRRAPGTPGAVSLEGSAAGILGALALAGCGALLASSGVDGVGRRRGAIAVRSSRARWRPRSRRRASSTTTC